MKIDVLTLFPGMFENWVGESILGRAQEAGRVAVRFVNIRDFAPDKHHVVDDVPYGGGAGMVMKPEPIWDATEAQCCQAPCRERIILLTPQGELLTQEKAADFAAADHLILICGRYEGVDERVRDHLVTDAISIGDYVLSGGELPAMVLVETVVRLLPGVLGREESAQTDTFTSGLLKYPQYTRPEEYRGVSVPEILRSGHHEQIRKWRREQALRRTAAARPDLLDRAELTAEDREILARIREQGDT
jgi:tRNA (guanine37-N1)-methyltransferase